MAACSQQVLDDVPNVLPTFSCVPQSVPNSTTLYPVSLQEILPFSLCSQIEGKGYTYSILRMSTKYVCVFGDRSIKEAHQP
jgi:hypothetical protein